MENPFRTLGLDPSALRGLNDERIARIVRGVYRTLQTVHHPDAGGNVARSTAINRAYEMLDPETRSPEVYKAAKEQFLKSGSMQRRLEHLEADVAQLEARERQLRARLVRNVTPVLECPTIHNLQGRTLELYDEVTRYNSNVAHVNIVELGQLAFRLRTTEHGFEVQGARASKHWNTKVGRVLFGCVPGDDWTNYFVGALPNVAPSRPTSEGQRVEMLGEIMTVRSKSERKIVSDVLSVELVTRYIERVVPYVDAGFTLLSRNVRAKREDALEFYIEGRVLRVK